MKNTSLPTVDSAGPDQKAPTFKPPLSGFQVFLRITVLTLFFLFIFFAITLAGVGVYAYRKLQLFTQNAHITTSQLIDTAKTGWKTSLDQTDDRVNFLVLGTDGLDNRGHATVLTDSMLIASIDTKTGQISLFSLPRDLWNQDYQTKINAFYEYGITKYPNQPQQFPKEIVENLVGIHIHHVVMMDMGTVASLIDMIGGIDVPVKESFTDNQFPREDVDVTKVKDPALLYKTITFTQGTEHMSGQRILEFVRSRHSPGDQGTDNARAARQQDVVFALISTLKQPSFYKDLARAGKLYDFYNQHFAQYFSVVQGISLAKIMIPVRNNIHFSTGGPAVFPDDPNGTIVHPPTSTATTAKYQGQWVYEVRDPQLFQKDAKQKLNLPQ